MLTDELTKYLDLTESAFEQARMQNEQLNKPIAKSTKRDHVKHGARADIKLWLKNIIRHIKANYIVQM